MVDDEPLAHEPLADGLPARWERDVRDGVTAVAAEVISAAGADLIARWREPHRRYHTVAHLVAVLTGVDELAAQAADPGAVRLAAWFHDAVYQGVPGVDEEQSALLAEQVLPGLGWPPDRVGEVARLVRLTADHAGITADDPNAAVLADADLAVLAAAEPDYRAYTLAIRAEYAHVPTPAFVVGRSQVMARLLAADPLYRTPTADRRWTARARANIRAELAELAVNLPQL